MRTKVQQVIKNLPVAEKLPLHIHSVYGEVAEYCYVEIEGKKYSVTHIDSRYMYIKKLGYTQVYLIINTMLGGDFSFYHLFDDTGIRLREVDLSLNRIVTYDSILTAINEYYQLVH